MKKFLVVLLSLNIMMTSAYAITFTDVDKNSWAMPYIEKMADLKIIVGYNDGRFAPNEKVNKYVAVLVTYRMLNSQGLIDENKKPLYISRYSDIIERNNVPNWPQLHEAIGFCIENQIITENDLKTFTNNNKNENINREEMALYLGKALNIYFNENVDVIINPVFKDHMSIDYDSLVYIDILNKKDIISGDNQGNFNPKKTLTRAELSKLLSRSIEELNKTIVKDEKIEANVKVKLDDTKNIIFYKKDSIVDSYREKITDDIEITVNDKRVGYDDLLIGMNVNLYYKNHKLIKITAESKDLDGIEKSGYVSEIVNNNNGKFMYIKQDDNTLFFGIDKGVDITENGHSASLFDIKQGDFVKVKLVDNLAKKIEFKKQMQNFSGKLEKIDIANNVITLNINDKLKDFNLANDVIVFRNGDKKNLTNLAKNDEVKIKLDFDYVKEIEAKGENFLINGFVSKIVLSKNPEIAIKDLKGEEKLYGINDNTKIYIDNKIANYGDLRIDYKVQIKTDGNLILELRASTSIDKKYIVGRITNKLDEVTSYIITTDDNIDYTVNTKSTTFYLNKRNDKSSFKTFEQGNKVFAYGVMEDKIMNAEKIIYLD